MHRAVVHKGGCPGADGAAGARQCGGMDVTPTLPQPPDVDVVLAAFRARDDLRRSVARDELHRIRRGAYAPPGAPEGAGRAARRRAWERIAAVHVQLRIPFVFSHESAALVWGLDAVRLSGRTHIVQASRPSTRNDPLLVRHVLDLPAEQRASVVHGYPVTTLARTVLDCACTLPGDAALVVADCAARAGLDLDDVDRLLSRAHGRRGVVGARTVLARTDAGAATPGESLARWALLDGGLPRPETQVPVSTRLGPFVVDIGWRERRVGVEFDGRVKYSGAFGDTSTGAVFAEKRRQDALEERGWRLLRVTWLDLRTPADVATRAARLLRRPATSAL